MRKLGEVEALAGHSSVMNRDLPWQEVHSGVPQSCAIRNGRTDFGYTTEVRYIGTEENSSWYDRMMDRFSAERLSLSTQSRSSSGK